MCNAKFTYLELWMVEDGATLNGVPEVVWCKVGLKVDARNG